MKAVVVGAGAMGGALASYLHRGGNEVSFIDAAEPVIKAIRANGVTFDSPDGPVAWRPQITSDPEALGIPDFMFVMVKGTATQPAMERSAGLVGEDTTVITLQNGWGGGDVIARFVDPARLVVGVTYSSSTVGEPGAYRLTGKGATLVGPFQNGSGMARSSSVAALLNDSNWPAEATERVKDQIWKKLILNAATLPTAALTGLSAGRLGQSAANEVVEDLAREAVAVAQAQGLDIELDERLESIRATLAAAGEGKASMLQDVLAQRRTEINTINGAIVRAGQSTNVPVPLNSAMVALVSGLESGWNR